MLRVFSSVALLTSVLLLPRTASADEDGIRIRGGFLAPAIGPGLADGHAAAYLGLFKVQLGGN